MEALVKFEAFKSFVFTLAIGLWLYWLWTRRNFYRFALKFPGTFGFPLLGMVNRILHPKDTLPAFGKLLMENKQDTICIWMGIHPILLTCSPELMEKILSSQDLLNKSKIFYEPVNDATLGGLFASRAEEWHPHRKLINPCFNHKVLASFLPIFHKTKQNTLTKFEAMVGTGEQKLSALLEEASMGITIETTMGKSIEDTAAAREFSKTVAFLIRSLITKIVCNVVGLKVVYSFYKRFNESLKYAHNFVNELVVSKLQRLNEPEQNLDQHKVEINKSSDVDAIRKTPKIFIDQAIEIYQKQQFSRRDIIAESITMIVGSFETTANGLFSLLVFLAMHPEVQEKLYEEIVSVFPEKDFEMEYEHMQCLPYLEMVINETLRLAPSVPIIGRQTERDTQLTKDILLPKGFSLFISIFHVHRNTAIWGPDANKFNPDNFLPENLSGKHSHAFIPFSKGPRNCIGWRYAMFAMKVMVAGFVRNYRFTTSFKFEDLQYMENISLKYYVEPKIEIHRR